MLSLQNEHNADIVESQNDRIKLDAIWDSITRLGSQTPKSAAAKGNALFLWIACNLAINESHAERFYSTNGRAAN